MGDHHTDHHRRSAHNPVLHYERRKTLALEYSNLLKNNFQNSKFANYNASNLRLARDNLTRQNFTTEQFSNRTSANDLRNFMSSRTDFPSTKSITSTSRLNVGGFKCKEYQQAKFVPNLNCGSHTASMPLLPKLPSLASNNRLPAILNSYSVSTLGNRTVNNLSITPKNRSASPVPLYNRNPSPRPPESIPSKSYRHDFLRSSIDIFWHGPEFENERRKFNDSKPVKRVLYLDKIDSDHLLSKKYMTF